MRTREHLLIRLLLALGLTSVVVLFAGVGVLFATQHRDNPKAPDIRVARIGGVDYEAMLGRLPVFRIPTQDYASEELELVIHDPSRPAATASLII